MIIIKTQGRLGNQLFQYAFAKNLNEKFYDGKEEIVINYGKSKYACKNILCDKNNSFKLKQLRTEKLRINIFQKIVFWTYLTIKYIFGLKNDAKHESFFNFFGIYFLQDDINTIVNFKKSKMKNKLIYGYFVSEKYFEDNKDIIKDEFSINKELNKDNKKMLKDIQSSNSVALCIRRGDYVNNDYFYVCDDDYYKAISLAKKDIKKPVFVVFSDDIKWVKDNMDLPKNTIYEKQDNDVFTTLSLMINCKHYIISNSTFHWWAQYMSKNTDDKMVYAPSIWNTENTAKPIYQSTWKKIEVKPKKKQ